MGHLEQVQYLRSIHDDSKLLEIAADLNSYLTPVEYNLEWLDAQEILKATHKKYGTTIYIFYNELKFISYLGDGQSSDDKKTYQLNYTRIGG